MMDDDQQHVFSKNNKVRKIGVQIFQGEIPRIFSYGKSL